jgi:superoxide dismutase, Cu-Zn family
MKRYRVLTYCFILTMVLSACSKKETSVQPAVADISMLKVSLINAMGKKIGTAIISPINDGVNIHIEASKLPPGIHGFHIHEVGLCEKPDFKTAGEHLNPFAKHHGFENPQGYHAGDLPNLEVGANGKISADIITKAVTLEKGKPNSLLRTQGASLIIHEKADDNMTDPSGNSGARIVCGVIK